jgi:hypothetical protein
VRQPVSQHPHRFASRVFGLHRVEDADADAMLMLPALAMLHIMPLATLHIMS